MDDTYKIKIDDGWCFCSNSDLIIPLTLSAISIDAAFTLRLNNLKKYYLAFTRDIVVYIYVSISNTYYTYSHHYNLKERPL